MKVTIAWWDLAESEQTIDTLRAFLHEEGVRPWADVPGLRLKFWFADRETDRWGAVLLWESDADLGRPLPPHRATELIGYPPTHRMRADIEAITEGVYRTRDLTDLGLAIATAGRPA